MKRTSILAIALLGAIALSAACKSSSTSSATGASTSTTETACEKAAAKYQECGLPTTSGSGGGGTSTGDPGCGDKAVCTSNCILAASCDELKAPDPKGTYVTCASACLSGAGGSSAGTGGANAGTGGGAAASCCTNGTIDQTVCGTKYCHADGVCSDTSPVATECAGDGDCACGATCQECPNVGKICAAQCP